MANTNIIVENGKTYKFHHSALCRGYVSVKATEGIREKYEGRFGKGYIVKRHNPESTQYCLISYYIEESVA